MSEQPAETPAEEKEEKKEPTPQEKAIAALKFRAIGPAVMGGRLSDIVVHPHKRSIWYISAGSGNIWKTENAGTTFKPIFDDQGSYSIGCLTLDPSTPSTVWVGTGENVSGRHVGYGDGVYKSTNGGMTWENMGLKASEHIGRILVDPRDGNTALVAAEGPLWSAGGERGVYKTTDGGQTWSHALEIDENTGVTSIEFDPSNPDVIYAAAYQRRRSVAAFIGGGPSSGIYKSTDNGETWRKITAGLPKGDMGKIGLAVTPADPNIVYATVEAKEKEKGFYRSTDKGESWEKRAPYISGGTGPHYYQRIFASPTNPDVIYQMDVFIHVTRNGGKEFKMMENPKGKHSDNHVVWIDPDNGEHLLVGCDAGLYETFDDGQTFRHFPNLPIAQFYRLAVDNSEPYYNIMGGAQDLGTLFGPSRTTNIEGVRNQDWYVPLGADGYHVEFDPNEPYILYLEFQNGNLFRYDRRSEEIISIKPLPAPEDPPERWNWDAPIIVSPHNPHRLYYASQRVWRSDDRGNSWNPISGDLSRNENRYELEIMGRVWSYNDLFDHMAMSRYNNITNLSESSLVEGLIYAGTDDGLIQVTEDGGQNWRTAAPLPDMPERAFIQSVRASQHDPNTIFAIADAHKLGDFAPYIFESNDRGRSWHPIIGDLPDGMILWALEQDHVKPELIFLAAEYGLYVTLNGGENWHKLKGNVPTIAFRDLKLHRRDEDLVGATFGRGFYVLDDYTALRDMADGALESEDGHLFPVRDAWWYIPHTPMQSPGQPTLGTTAFKAANPDFGAMFTYYLQDSLLTSKKARQKAEAELRKDKADTPFPGWETLQQEPAEPDPQVLFLVSNEAGEPVRWVKGPSTEAGLHRVSWDLRLEPADPVRLKAPDFLFPWQSPPAGALVPPGNYSVQMHLVTAGEVKVVGEPRPFTLKPLLTTPEGTDFTAATDFKKQAHDLLRRLMGAEKEIGRARDRLKHCHAALAKTPQADTALFGRVATLLSRLETVDTALTGDKIRNGRNDAAPMSIRERVFWLVFGYRSTRQEPTSTQRQSFELANSQFDTLLEELKQLIYTDLVALEADLTAAGAPWTPGRKLD